MKKIASFVREHSIFLAAFGAALILSLGPLFDFRRGFLNGDYALQFYPFGHVLAEALRRGELPLWTPLVQCGFYLFGEGQTGMLYPLNLILFRAFSLNTAYNLAFLSHFILGGVFSYIFARKKGMSVSAATFTTLVYTFGSAAAGCYYNISSMRSLVWFPLALYAVDTLVEKTNVRSASLLALSVGLSWLAGFPQTALYALGFVSVYYVCAARKTGSPRAFMLFILALFLGILMGLPQLWATLEFSSHSSRMLYDKRFILWGSAPPWSLFTAFQPTWSPFLGAELYVGILPLLFFISPVPPRAKLWWGMAALSFALALGMFNPLYWVLTQLPMASLLRKPAKFLYFTGFFLSVAAGFYFDQWRERISRADREWLHRSARRAGVLAAALGVSGLTAAALVRAASGLLERYGEWYVRHFVLGRNYHQGSPDYYFDKMRGLLSSAQEVVDPAKASFWLPLALAAFGWALMAWAARKRFSARTASIAALCVLIADLYFYGQSGLFSKTAPFTKLQRSELATSGRWLDLDPREETAVFTPNVNMLSGHAQAGVYAPLVDREYFELVRPFGVVDDSFGRTRYVEGSLKASKPLLNFLGVRHIAGPEPGRFRENAEALEEFTLVPRVRVISGAADRLKYLQSEGFNPREEVVLASSLEAGTGGSGTIRVLKNENKSASVEIVAPRGGVLVRNQVYDKGWRASVDARPVPVLRANGAFQAVALPPGAHRVEWSFRPDAFFIGRWISLAAMIAVLSGFFIRTKKIS